MTDIIHDSGGASPPTQQALSPHSSTSDEDDDVPLGKIFGDMPATPSRQQRKTAPSLSDEHKSVLLTVFQPEISTGKLLTMQEVRAKMRDSHVLRIYVVQPDFVKRVADFVHYNTNATRQIQLTTFPDLDPDDSVASFSNNSGLRKVWSPHDVAVIEAKFKDLKKVPPKGKILTKFRQDPVLSHILERKGQNRCYEKVKTLLRRQ